MNDEKIVAMLDYLGELRLKRDMMVTSQGERVEAAVTPAVQAAIDAIYAETNPGINSMGQEIGELEEGIRTAVLAQEASVKASTLHAVFAKGRTTWDNKALDGYSVAHPEILNFQKIGQPTVSIRSAK